MHDRISTPEAYATKFPQAKREFALEKALDIRKFEIERYWQRATYFWTLIAAVFAGYALIRSAIFRPGAGSEHLAGDRELILFLLTCVGCLLSLAWYLVNRGSKYWQENWERHVDVLESLHVGPLYKMTLTWTQLSWLNPHGGFPYSVSKINQLVSLYLTIIWMVLAVDSFLTAGKHEDLLLDQRMMVNAIALISGAFALLLIVLPQPWRPWKKGPKVRKVSFSVHPLASAEGDVSSILVPADEQDVANGRTETLAVEGPPRSTSGLLSVLAYIIVGVQITLRLLRRTRI